LRSGTTWNQIGRAPAVRIGDAVLADAQILLGHPDLAPVVVPGGEAGRGRRTFIPQGGGPEAGQRIRIGAVDHQLEGDGHQPLLEIARQVSR
jgi:hypothetical protein